MNQESQADKETGKSAQLKDYNCKKRPKIWGSFHAFLKQHLPQNVVKCHAAQQAAKEKSHVRVCSIRPGKFTLASLLRHPPEARGHC